MLPLYYQNLQFASVKSIPDLFKDRSKDMIKVKQVYSAAKILFKTGRDPVMEICQSEEIYKIVILEKSYKKLPIAEIVVIPKDRRLDLFDNGNLIAQWMYHKLEYRGFSDLLESMKFDKNFISLYNVL